MPTTWEEILSKLADDERAAYEEHVAGLKSALASERLIATTAKGKATSVEEMLAAAISQREVAEQAKTALETVYAATKAELETSKAEKAREKQIAKIVSLATAAKFIDPNDAVPFILGKLELDSAGEPTNAKTLVEDLAKTHKHFVVQPVGTPGHGQPPAGNETKLVGSLPTF